MAAPIAKRGDFSSHPLPLSTGRIRLIRLICPICPICPRGFSPAPLPFAEEQLLSVVGLVGLVGLVGEKNNPVYRGESAFMK